MSENLDKAREAAAELPVVYRSFGDASTGSFEERQAQKEMNRLHAIIEAGGLHRRDPRLDLADEFLGVDIQPREGDRPSLAAKKEDARDLWRDIEEKCQIGSPSRAAQMAALEFALEDVQRAGGKVTPRAEPEPRSVTKQIRDGGRLFRGLGEELEQPDDADDPTQALRESKIV